MVTKVRRSPWMNDRAALLVKLLRERHGLETSEDTARHDISEHVDHVAALMRIGRQAANYYVTEDVIAELANRIAGAVHQHHEAIRQRQAVDLDAERRPLPYKNSAMASLSATALVGIRCPNRPDAWPASGLRFPRAFRRRNPRPNTWPRGCRAPL
jgi:hypothetical protein